MEKSLLEGALVMVVVVVEVVLVVVVSHCNTFFLTYITGTLGFIAIFTRAHQLSHLSQNHPLICVNT
jgi:hypothetical protein